MHKLTKTILHLWITLISLLALAFGWVFLAHAQKPAPLIATQVESYTTAQPTLAPVPSLNDLLKNSTSSAPPLVQNPTVMFPRLRARGS
jgi:hypothetical protein